MNQLSPGKGVLEEKLQNNYINLPKNLVISKKSSIFAAGFEKRRPNNNKIINTIMKKVLFIAAAFLTLAFGFTGCKDLKLADVQITVMDNDNQPIADRVVIYDDAASAIISALIPDPTDPLKSEEDWAAELSYVVTNKQGTVILRDLIVDNHYYFYTYDEGSNQWLSKDIKIQEGQNSVEFKVNK